MAPRAGTALAPPYRSTLAKGIPQERAAPPFSWFADDVKDSFARSQQIDRAVLSALVARLDRVPKAIISANHANHEPTLAAVRTPHERERHAGSNREEAPRYRFAHPGFALKQSEGEPEHRW